MRCHLCSEELLGTPASCPACGHVLSRGTLHWTCSTEEWERFIQQSRRRSLHQLVPLYACWCGLFLVIAAVLALAFPLARLLQEAPFLLEMLGLWVVISLLFPVEGWLRLRRRRGIRQAEYRLTPEHLSGPEGQYSLLQLVAVRLREGEPLVLKCRFRIGKEQEGLLTRPPAYRSVGGAHCPRTRS